MNKSIVEYILIGISVFVFASCTKTSEYMSANHIYFDRSSEQAVTKLSVAIRDEYSESLNALVPRKTAEDVDFSIGVNPDLVKEFNQTYGENAILLPNDYYILGETVFRIPAGSVASSEITVDFHNVLDLDENTTYVLPIVIKSASVPIIEKRAVKYYFLKSSGIINIVPNLDGRMEKGTCLEYGNYIDIPWTKNDCVKNLTAFTFEAYAYAEFSTDGLPTLSMKKCDNYRSADNMYSLMGSESGLLVRRWGNLENSKWDADPSLGQDPDIRYALEVKNLKNPSDSREGIRLPDFPDRKWTAFTLTYDQATGLVKLYYNQKLVYSEDIGPDCPVKIFPETSKDPDFYIGRSNSNRIRWWSGMVSEVRVWNRALTDEEIADPLHPYYIDTTDPVASKGLVGYWKCDEGHGQTFFDHSGNGNNGTAIDPVKWTEVKLPEEKIIIKR